MQIIALDRGHHWEKRTVTGDSTQVILLAALPSCHSLLPRRGVAYLFREFLRRNEYLHCMLSVCMGIWEDCLHTGVREFSSALCVEIQSLLYLCRGASSFALLSVVGWVNLSNLGNRYQVQWALQLTCISLALSVIKHAFWSLSSWLFFLSLSLNWFWTQRGSGMLSAELSCSPAQPSSWLWPFSLAGPCFKAGFHDQSCMRHS